MSTTINAQKHVGTSFPPEEGERLAEFLLKQDMDWANLEIDLSRSPASLLISAFFNAFLQKVYEEEPDLLEKAKAIKWKLAHKFQEENVREWIADFKPFTQS